MTLREFVKSHGKRSDAIKLDPRVIRVKPGLNLRSGNNPKEDEILESIKQGVNPPAIEVYYDSSTGVPYVVNGHTSLRAYMRAIEQGVPIEYVEVNVLPTQDEADLTVIQLVHNNGEPLPPIDAAEGYKRLRAWGWSVEQIASKVGKEAGSIYRALELLKMPQDIQRMVKQEQVSSTSVIRIHQETEDIQAAKPVLQLVAAGEVTAEAAVHSLKLTKGDADAAFDLLVEAAEAAEVEKKVSHLDLPPLPEASSKGKGRRKKLAAVDDEGKVVPPASTKITPRKLLSRIVFESEVSLDKNEVQLIISNELWDSIKDLIGG